MQEPDEPLPARATGSQIGRAVLSLLIVFVVVFALAAVTRGRLSLPIQEIVGASAAFVLYVLLSRWLEHWHLPETNPHGRTIECAGGVALGIGLFSAVMAALWFLGAYHPVGWGGLSGLASGLLLAAGSAVLEEILFRAYLYRILAMVSGTWISVLLTAAFFGAAHAGNHGATLFSSIAIALEAGVLLSGAYAATGRLWVPIGLHFGWNFAESTLFGMSVSGLPETSALSHGTLKGSALLTGGAFGPEASIAAVCLCLVPGIAFLWHTARKGRVQPPVWNRQ